MLPQILNIVNLTAVSDKAAQELDGDIEAEVATFASICSFEVVQETQDSLVFSESEMATIQVQITLVASPGFGPGNGLFKCPLYPRKRTSSRAKPVNESITQAQLDVAALPVVSRRTVGARCPRIIVIPLRRLFS